MRGVHKIMDVRLGWSGDIHGSWTKMDVLVEEVDLLTHLTEAGAKDVENLRIPVTEKFKLMYSLAEIFVSLHKMSRFPEFFGKDSDKAELRKLVQERDAVTAKILSSEPPF